METVEGIENPDGGGEDQTPNPPADDANPASSAELEETPPDPKPDPVQSRIDTITREKWDAVREAAYWKGIAEGKGKPETPTPEPVKSKVDELDPNDFDSDADYLKEVARVTREEIKNESATEQRKAQERDRISIINSRYEEGRKKWPDFDQVALNNSLQVTQTMFDAAMGENLDSILYHLGRNPSEAVRISQLSPLQQAKEIGRIEDRINTKPKPKPSNAPAPPKVLDGSGGSPPPKPDSEKSRAELRADWEKNRRKRLGVA